MLIFDILEFHICSGLCKAVKIIIHSCVSVWNCWNVIVDMFVDHLQINGDSDPMVTWSISVVELKVITNQNILLILGRPIVFILAVIIIYVRVDGWSLPGIWYTTNCFSFLVFNVDIFISFVIFIFMIGVWDLWVL